MKFQALIGEDKHDVEVRREGSTLFAKVDDREYQLEQSEPEPNVFLFKYKGRVFEATVSRSPGGATHVRIGADEFDISLIDPKRLRGTSGIGDSADGLAEIRTAMPGKVVRIIAEPGIEVTKGDAVLVVEAMKMQNELKSPKTGHVKEIRVIEGATVSAGEILATIE